MEGLSVALPFSNTAEVDLLNFGASLSFDLCKAGHCDQLLDRAKYTGLVTLLGAGGVVLYLTKQKQKTIIISDHDRESWMSKLNVLKWIFENDHESDESYDPSFSTFLKGYNFGLLLPQSNEIFSSTNILPMQMI